jgi:hypothetical protein
MSPYVTFFQYYLPISGKPSWSCLVFPHETQNEYSLLPTLSSPLAAHRHENVVRSRCKPMAPHMFSSTGCCCSSKARPLVVAGTDMLCSSLGWLLLVCSPPVAAALASLLLHSKDPRPTLLHRSSITLLVFIYYVFYSTYC